MSGVDAEILKFLAAVALLIIGAVLKAGFDRLAVERGWTREDKKAQDGKIERIDSHARSEITRIERELGGKISELGTDVSQVTADVRVLTERIENLPTADDIQSLDRRLAAVDRGLSAVVSKVDGTSANVKTILEHILAGERRG